MVSYLVQGLLSNSTSLLVEGFTSTTTPTNIKLYFYLNKFSINPLTALGTINLINNTKLTKISVSYKYSKLTMLNKNKLTKYKISKYSYLNKINVN